MLKLLAVGAGGFFGAIARYALSGLVHRYAKGDFPAGTLAVNVLGCLIIGVLIALVEDRSSLPSTTRLFVVIGLLGSLTTFSTFGHETIQLIEDGALRSALWNVGANVVLGLIAVVLGRFITRAVAA